MNIFIVLDIAFPLALAAAGSLVLGRQFAIPNHGGEATFTDKETWEIAGVIFLALSIIFIALVAVGLVASWFA